LIYDHPSLIVARAEQAKKIEKLFAAYNGTPELMTGYDENDVRGKGRQIADNIASLTDRGVDRELDKILSMGVNKSVESSGQSKKMKRSF
jgi:dGTP triphosphohydrolase